MKKDKAAWAGTMIFLVLMVLVVFRPPVSRRFPRSEPEWGHPKVDRDLRHIRKDTLRVLVMRDPLTWEERPGAVTGLEWELLERFARREELPILAIPVDDPDSMLIMLQRGQGDIMAAQLCPTGWAARFVAFSEPYRSLAPLRIGLNADAVVRSTIRDRYRPGEPDTLLMSRWAPFLGQEALLDTAFGHIKLVVDTALPEDLLARIALGKAHAAVVVDAVSSMEARRLPHIEFGPRLGRSVPIAFATRRNARKLLRAINHWIDLPREAEARELIADSYGEGRLTKGPLRSLREIAFNTDSISPFDSLFQAHADSATFDWELLAAVGFKESRFDTSATSRAGAAGMMQIMPRTAAALGVDPIDGVGGHIGGARKFLDKLDAVWRPTVPDQEQRLKFVLASYNAGSGHIKDAQRLAEACGLDPHRWDGSVERALLLLSKPRWYERPEVKNGYCRAYETFWYVRDVISTFRQFRRNGTRK